MAVDIPVQILHPSEADLPPPTRTTWLLITLTLLAVMGGFTWGYDLGIVSGAMIIMKYNLNLDDFWQELIVSMTNVGAAVASLGGGILTSLFGKKRVILAACLSFATGAAICAFSPNKAVLLVGRVILGFAIGICSCSIPAYVSECSPIHVRGRMLTMWQTLISFGFWVSGLLAAALSYIHDQSLSWRLMLGLAGVPAIIQFIGFCFMPESPRWLAMRGREEEAMAIMTRIYGNDDAALKNAEFEMKLIKHAEMEGKRERAELGVENKFALFAIFRIPHLRKAVIIGCSLQICQQLSGINTIMYYSASIMTMAGISDPTVAIWLASVTSGVLFFAGFIGIYFVDKIGRRLLMIYSGAGVFVCLIIMGAAFTLLAKDAPLSTVPENRTSLLAADSCTNLSCDACSYIVDCGFCFDSNQAFTTGACVRHSSYQGANGDGRNWAAYGRCARDFNQSTDPVKFPLVDPSASWNYGFCPTSLSWLPILGMVLYLVAFSVGYAPMPWTINAELYPNWVRSTGTSLSSAWAWICNIIVTLTFLSLARGITREGTYFLYAGITAIGVVWLYLVLPETKGKDIEAIQFSLMGPWFTRGRAGKSDRKLSDVALSRVGPSAVSVT